jgi:hypothetical protein
MNSHWVSHLAGAGIKTLRHVSLVVLFAALALASSGVIVIMSTNTVKTGILGTTFVSEPSSAYGGGQWATT